MEDVSRYPYLFAELLESERWTEEDIAKLAGRNLIRVFRQVEQVSGGCRGVSCLTTCFSVKRGFSSLSSASTLARYGISSKPRECFPSTNRYRRKTFSAARTAATRGRVRDEVRPVRTTVPLPLLPPLTIEPIHQNRAPATAVTPAEPGCRPLRLTAD